MKAMVLAAGVGRRLRPLTDRIPKALIKVGGVPMLEIVLRRLKAIGVEDVVINVCHLADRVLEFLEPKRRFGIHVEISREAELLDTGGGLKKVADFFRGKEPFLVHNVDVLSEVDLTALYQAHQSSGALATLAVRKRDSRRQLLFDAQGRLVGREVRGIGELEGGKARPMAEPGDGKARSGGGLSQGDSPQEGVEWAQAPVAAPVRLGFDGIHVISPDIFPKMTETGIFPITQTYLRLAGVGERILSFRTDGYYWRDIGSIANLEEARRYAEQRREAERKGE